MCEDFRGMRDGFPDLMHVRDGKVSFIEIKAEGDVIRRNQLTRLRQLGNAGIPAEIGRVDYRFDPEQDYVVVDIETTGAWSSGDRITEIGAVKIRNHQVVDEWHTLINPQRSIPTKIVELTGITNQMVRDAPVFREVADSFMAFMGDGIFVAHNVNFDYGFLSYEYERLERRFRFPKLCTCAGMRRRYPGHKSYGLGKLCEIYDIALDDHHRALCDARAAARLLNLINKKRDDGVSAKAEWPLSHNPGRYRLSRQDFCDCVDGCLRQNKKMMRATMRRVVQQTPTVRFIVSRSSSSENGFLIIGRPPRLGSRPDS